jgi:hypothetical protein
MQLGVGSSTDYTVIPFLLLEFTYQRIYQYHEVVSLSAQRNGIKNRVECRLV